MISEIDTPKHSLFLIVDKEFSFRNGSKIISVSLWGDGYLWGKDLMFSFSRSKLFLEFFSIYIADLFGWNWNIWSYTKQDWQFGDFNFSGEKVDHSNFNRDNYIIVYFKLFLLKMARIKTKMST